MAARRPIFWSAISAVTRLISDRGGLALFLGAALAGAPIPNALAVELDRIVAIVNNDVVLESELERMVHTVREQLREKGAEPPPTRAIEREVLDRLILNKLQLQLAENSGIRVDDDALNRTISEIASRNGVTLSQFRQIIENDGYSFEAFREDIRKEMIIARLRQQQVENRITVTDREIEHYLATRAHQGAEDAEAEYRLAHILIAVPEEADPDEIEARRQVAVKVVEELRAGRDFAELARSVSDGQQAELGGDLGWRKKADLPSLFADIAIRMQPGEISDPIESPGGYHIIKLIETRGVGRHVITQTHARHILVRTNELVSNADARLKLEQLRLRLDGGADFAELAKAHSEDSVSAAQGGDLGWLSPGETVPEFEEMMNALDPGEISQPFQTDFGWHIVQVLERREHDGTEELKRARAREAIRKRKIEEAVQNWLRDMRNEAYVEYRLNE